MKIFLAHSIRHSSDTTLQEHKCHYLTYLDMCVNNRSLFPIPRPLGVITQDRRHPIPMEHPSFALRCG